MKTWVFAVFAFAAGSTLADAATAAMSVTPPQSAVLASWKGEELATWTQKIYRCTNARIAAEGLSATSIGADPQLGTVLKRPFGGKCNQYVEMVLRSAVAGRCQLFWESEKYGKCTEERSAAFNVTKADEWATFKICPCWVGEGRITLLRIDPPDALRGTFELKSVRVFEEGDDAGIDTCKFTGVAFDAVTPDISFASLTWKTDTSPGWKLLGFTTPSDGRRHTYWFDFKNAHNLKYRFAGKDAWTGTAYSLRPMSILANRPLPVENLRLLTCKPDLPPDVGVTYVGPELAIPRAGRPLALELILRNYGTVAARNIRFALDGLPKGCRVLDAADLAPDGEIGACEGWDSVGDHRATGQLPNERRFRVTLSDPGAGRHSFRLAISADGMATRTVPVVAELLPSLGLAKADYVPEPKPVKTGRFEIGAFLFPGWDTALWHGVWTRTPIRKPVLGWYDETNPEVIDWQIKHLVENGFSFVFVDWYWDRGRQWHNHWPAVFGKARYRHLLKWSLMWANHNGPGSHSTADQEKVTKFWIDNFFRDPQYMLQDGKPVVSIYLPHNMERDVGPGGCRKLLDISRRVAREAGFPGIHFMAVRLPSGFTNREFLKQFEEYGFDGTCVYKYMGEGNPKVSPGMDGFMDYKDLAETSLNHWRTLRANSRLPFLPSLTTAYDDRAWRGEKSSPVKNINAADFKRICEDAKKFSAETGVTRFLTGPIDEWGEGSIGYPNRERGFGMFEAVRDTFGEKTAGGWPLNYAPEDVGLGPYPRADDPLSDAGRKGRDTTAASKRRPMALLIMWDGARADSLLNAGCSNLLMLAEGRWKPGYKGAWSFCAKPLPDARPYSYANHASILNGVIAAKHGVWFNHETAKCRTKEWPSWLSRLMDAKPSARTVFASACRAVAVDLCRDERIAIKDFGLDGEAEADYFAKLYSSSDAPDAAVMFIDQPDATGHQKGFYPTPPEYLKAVKSSDVLLGRVLAAIAARPTFDNEDWLIAMTSDHGGYARMHGWRDSHSTTIPVILAGRHVVPGNMAGFPHHYDLPVTALAHFGVSTDGMGLDGVIIGRRTTAWKAAPSLDDSLTWYFPIETRNKYLINAVRGGPGTTNIGDEEYFNPNRTGGTFKTPCLWIGGAEDVPCGARLEDSVDMFLRPRPEFTVTFWTKMTPYPCGDSVVFGNKDYARTGSPGFVIATGRSTERAPKGICVVFGTPAGKDLLMGTYDIEGGDKWTFYALTFNAEGQAWFYQGRSNGVFNWVCDCAGNALLGSGLPLHIGQDGTGSFKWNRSCYLDDIAVWKRSLTTMEIRSIYLAGREGRQLKGLLEKSKNMR